MKRCDLSDLPEDQCACRIHKPEPKTRESGSHAFRAKFDGWCIGCERSIDTGDRVIFNSDGVVVHEGCA